MTANIGIPDTVKVVSTVGPDGTAITVIERTPAPVGYTISYDPGWIREDPLIVIRLLSIIGWVIICGLGIIFAGNISKKALQPLDKITSVARNIDARSLGTRLNYQGPTDEVMFLAQTIDELLARLDVNFERQGQFIANLAHELRTPLTAMRMNWEAISSDPQASLKDYQELEQVETKALLRLERLIEDLLLLAKGEVEITPEPILLGVLFEEIFEELRPLADEHQITLKMGENTDFEIRADPLLLQRAISNLVENGILYNHAGGYVEVSARCRGDQIVIEVNDDGIGIEKDQQNQIFSRFYRTRESRKKRPIGKGLGLAITSHIIEIHGGSIELVSNPKSGSTFRLILDNGHTC